VSQRSPSSEPMFNVPPAVLATVAVLVLVHAARALLLSERADAYFLLTFAFIPARYDADIGGSLPGGFGAELWTFFTYAFLHADLLHLGVNIAWLLPFGTALARRFGAWRYAAFMLVTAAAGAFAHLISYRGAMVPMIGASAAISGMMAAAMRFVFQQGGPLAVWRRQSDGKSYRVPASPLFATLREPRFLIFLAVWIGLNDCLVSAHADPPKRGSSSPGSPSAAPTPTRRWPCLMNSSTACREPASPSSQTAGSAKPLRSFRMRARWGPTRSVRKSRMRIGFRRPRAIASSARSRASSSTG